MLKINYSQSQEHRQEYQIADTAFENYLNTIQTDEIGFFRIHQRDQYISTCRKVFEKYKNKKHFVQIGIGGSSLGPEMLVSALNRSERTFTFINNIDPDMIDEQLKKIDLKESLFYVVSKSGGTAETVAGLSIAINQLKNVGVTEDQLNQYFVFATDQNKSQLKDLSEKLNIDTLEVPGDVGGRFSVLTPVGMLTALFADLKVEEFFNGIKSIEGSLTDKKFLGDFANFLWGEYLTDKSQTVIMPYSSKLRDLAFWFVQLWAESLGKEKNRSGEIVETGFTPVPGYGATDQHSQVQLFMEGPRDKVLLLVEVEKFANDFSLASGIDLPSFQKLEKFNLSQLMKAELEGTKKALKERNRPYASISIPELNEFYLAQVIILFESLTALMGEYLDINAFDQPGVELGKVYAFEYLSNL